MKKTLNILIALIIILFVSSCIPTPPVGGNTSPNIVYKQYNHVVDYYYDALRRDSSWLKTRYYDIDNDSQNDFIIASHIQSPDYPALGIGANVSFVNTRVDVYYSVFEFNNAITVPYTFQINEAIDDNITWSNHYLTAQQAATNTGGQVNYPFSFMISETFAGFTTISPSINFYRPVAQDQTYYLGIKIVKNNNNYYGWLRLKHESPVLLNGQIGAKVTVLESAFNTNPNEPILAGKK